MVGIWLVSNLSLSHNCVAIYISVWDSQVAVVVKNLPANIEDTRNASSIPESGRSPGVGNDSPLQYSCLGNPIDRRAWWTKVHAVTKEVDTT